MPRLGQRAHRAHGQPAALRAICFNTLGGRADLDPTACLANIFGSTGRTGAEPAVRRARAARGGRAQHRARRRQDRTRSPATARCSRASASSRRTAASSGRSRRCATTAIDKATVDLIARPGRRRAPDITNASRRQPAARAGLDDLHELTVAHLLQRRPFGGSLSAELTDPQEALLGCGRFYGTSCDLDGVDFLNMEASVLSQSWPHVEGTFRGKNRLGHDRLGHRPARHRRASRAARSARASRAARASSCPAAAARATTATTRAWTAATTGLLHPFTGQQFRTRWRRSPGTC